MVRLFDIGVFPGDSAKRKNQTRTINIICVTLILIGFLYAGIYLVIGVTHLAYLNLFFAGLLTFPIILNHFRKYYPSRISILTILNVSFYLLFGLSGAS